MPEELVALKYIAAATGRDFRPGKLFQAFGCMMKAASAASAFAVSRLAIASSSNARLAVALPVPGSSEPMPDVSVMSCGWLFVFVPYYAARSISIATDQAISCRTNASISGEDCRTSRREISVTAPS